MDWNNGNFELGTKILKRIENVFCIAQRLADITEAKTFPTLKVCGV